MNIMNILLVDCTEASISFTIHTVEANCTSLNTFKFS